MSLLVQPGSAAHLALVREAANYKLKYGRKKEAISDLEQLWKWVSALETPALISDGSVAVFLSPPELSKT